MTYAFVYSSDYQLVLSKGLTIQESIEQGYIVPALVKDTHVEMYQDLKIRVLN